MENGFIESFNGKLRDECLNTELFFSVEDARQKLEAWRKDYNEQRPHSALGGIPPAEFIQRVVETRKTPHQPNFLLLRLSSKWVQVTCSGIPVLKCPPAGIRSVAPMTEVRIGKDRGKSLPCLPLLTGTGQEVGKAFGC